MIGDIYVMTYTNMFRSIYVNCKLQACLNINQHARTIAVFHGRIRGIHVWSPWAKYRLQPRGPHRYWNSPGLHPFEYLEHLEFLDKCFMPIFT